MDIQSKVSKELSDSINKCFNWNVRNENNKTVFSLIGWNIEITVPMVDAANQKRAKAQHKKIPSMLYECITEVLRTLFDINLTSNDKCVDVLSDADINANVSPQLQNCYSICKSNINSLSQPIVVVNDNPRTGKTLLVKWYLSLRRKNAPGKVKIWWLDFNGGFSDIRTFIVGFLSHPLHESNYIVLDNLECCGFVDSQRILKFFVDFINRLNETCSQRLKLFVIQDKTMEIFPDYNSFENVIVYESLLLEKYKKANISQTFTDISYKKICNDIDTFLANNPENRNNPENKQIISLFLRLVIFSKFGVSISSNEKARLLKKITGVRVTKSGEIISFSRTLSERILAKYSERLKLSLGSEALSDYSNDFLSCYYQYLDLEEKPIAISSIKQIIDNIDSNSVNIGHLKSVLEKSENLVYYLADIINDTENITPFSNHLGATLFAAEAMASYSSSNWKTLHAWSKLRNHILEFYYVDNQEERLPEISYAHKKHEGTYKDFFGNTSIDTKHYDCFENCIISHILLQDEFISNTSTLGYSSLESSQLQELKNNSGIIDDHLFDLFISPLQIDSQPLDFDKFFRTYLLALLFEFEVTAPSELRNQERIDILLKKIKYNIQSIDANRSFFYPKRVPWVSARMLLALCYYRNHFNGKPDLTSEIETIIKSLARYLIRAY